jgi:twinkle protein
MTPLLPNPPQDCASPPHALDMQSVYMQAIQELAKPFPAVQLPEWDCFNRMTGGFRPREFSIFCGPTGSGKTTWLANLSAQLLKANTKHFVMSVETGHTDFMKRIMSALAGKDFNTGEAISTQDIARFQVEHGRYLETNAIEFSLYEDRLPVEQLMADIAHMVFEKGCKIAIVDNLNFFMEVTSANNAVIEMDRVIHNLIIFCKKVDVHIIMVMHPKKTDGARIENEFDIKGSSTAVQEAHNVFLFNRPRPDDVMKGFRDVQDREIKIAKMRRRGVNVGKSIVYRNSSSQYLEGGIF